MSDVFFQPFVGKDYANGGLFGKRTILPWATPVTIGIG